MHLLSYHWKGAAVAAIAAVVVSQCCCCCFPTLLLFSVLLFSMLLLMPPSLLLLFFSAVVATIAAVACLAVHTCVEFHKLRLHHSIHTLEPFKFSCAEESLLLLLPKSCCAELAECLRGVMRSESRCQILLCIHIVNPWHVSLLTEPPIYAIFNALSPW